MKVEIKLFGLLVPIFVGFTLIYGYFTQWNEWVGIVGLALSSALAAFVSGFLWLTARKMDLRPDDNPQGEIAEAAGDYGFFSPHSWWPQWLGLSSAVLFLGVAVGWWMVIIAAPFAAVAVVGWTFEYFRGQNAV